MRITSDILLNRTPIKQVFDALAIGKILALGNPYGTEKTYGLHERLACLQFYYAGETNRLHAASPRSGSLWSELGIALAIDLFEGGDGEYEYSNGMFFPTNGLYYRRLDWRLPTGELAEYFNRETGPIFGPLRYFHSRNPYWGIRHAGLQRMRIFLLSRNILDLLESWYDKLAQNPDVVSVTSADEDSFRWDKHLTDAIRFTNSWGDVLCWHPHIVHFRYEDLAADPVATHREILQFWGYDIPDDLIAEGFRRASRKEMKKRMPVQVRSNNPRVSNATAESRGRISPERKKHLVDRLNSELIFNLGHAYGHDVPYGTVYD